MLNNTCVLVYLVKDLGVVLRILADRRTQVPACDFGRSTVEYIVRIRKTALDCGANFFGYNKKIDGFFNDNRLKLILYDIYI